MKSLFLGILFLCALHIEGYNQTVKLVNSAIYSALYPNNKEFDNKNRVIRKIKRDNENLEFRTEVEKTFYFTKGSAQKAIVVLFSHNYTDGKEEEILPNNGPEIEIATFNFDNVKWNKIKFVQNFYNQEYGQWGVGPKLSFVKYKLINCLRVSLSGSSHNEEWTETKYYDAETLKEVK